MRRRQTHLVLGAKLRWSAYEDGGELRAITDGKVLSRWVNGAWSPPAREAREKPGQYDHIKPLGSTP